MPPASPTIFVAHFPNRQVDRLRTPQRILSRDEQVRSAAEALRGILRGSLHLRDVQCKIKSIHGSPLKAARKQALQCWIVRPNPVSARWVGTSSRYPLITTRAPDPRNRLAVASPIPVPPPVIKTTFSSNDMTLPPMLQSRAQNVPGRRIEPYKVTIIISKFMPAPQSLVYFLKPPNRKVQGQATAPEVRHSSGL